MAKNKKKRKKKRNRRQVKQTAQHGQNTKKEKDQATNEVVEENSQSSDTQFDAPPFAPFMISSNIIFGLAIFIFLSPPLFYDEKQEQIFNAGKYMTPLWFGVILWRLYLVRQMVPILKEPSSAGMPQLKSFLLKHNILSITLVAIALFPLFSVSSVADGIEAFLSEQFPKLRTDIAELISKVVAFLGALISSVFANKAVQALAYGVGSNFIFAILRNLWNRFWGKAEEP